MIKQLLSQSTCSRNSDCPRLRSSGGLCRRSSNILCEIGSKDDDDDDMKYSNEISTDIFGGRRRNCAGMICAQCVNDVDCGGRQYCQGFVCFTSQDLTRLSALNNS